MIPVFKPSYTDKEARAVQKTLQSGWVGLGPRTKEFEEKFAAYIGVKYAVAVNSATSALHLAFRVADIASKEVITTPMTFVSTNHAILYNNGIPVFADIEPDTLNIDARNIEPLISGKTRALCVVHYGGYACDMDPVMRVAKKHNLQVIEDCAHACGGEYKKKKLGSIGHLGCFSFHAVKNLATGDGGMITTNNRDYYESLLKLRWMGIDKNTWERTDTRCRRYSWYYNITDIGFKMHMNDIAASLGLVQLDRLDAMNARRADITARYNKAFSGLTSIALPPRKAYMTKPAHHNYVIKYHERDKLNEWLAQNGISSGVHYIPSNHYAIYRGYRGSTPVCDETWKYVLTLPLFPDLGSKEVKHIIACVRSGVGGK
ncbi:MAG: DegT/DnrJ/EryC1/StrS family aminotransferase [Chitinispirillaceae bacterium]|nr:DegT/DnrJ/EryC1/StrS family aminotransferase [Chitinispirillaceae bacterium]